jgi:regulator of cell morphogenesis and NO signaling
MTDIRVHSLGDIVAANPTVARVLDGYGLDYCCHGDRTLAQACADAGLDLATVIGELAATGTEGDTAWTALEPAALADHIVTTHHRYLWDELPLVEQLAGKVLGVHAVRHPELDQVVRLVTELRAELEPHLRKEERVLFPAIAALASGQRDFSFGSVANPIRMMLLEHDRAGEILTKLRDVTDAYSAPADGCASYRSLYERLGALELDTHLHIHKENHALFPAALRLAET